MRQASTHPGGEALLEPIPGYVLREKLGSGGCGEVWKADAPGGFSKAVKIVFGNVDESRAINERQSLELMKNVRHPFLLSIERIEVVSGHLVVVTELAESSVKDRFLQCQQLGQSGISRAELIGYLRDTADALDYLYEKYSIQHLDVKPENLLLVGNRVKLADFGLVTKVGEATQVATGGLTPMYAAPEVFDGRPTRYSDQYSLAIVFQEMLTGQSPFTGRTAAQLAAQHLQTQPVLSHLPPNDRHVVARALSKLPDQRYGGCREFIEALIAADQASRVSFVMPSAPVSPPGDSLGLGADSAALEFVSTDEVMQNASHTLSLSEDYLREISSQRTQCGQIDELPPLAENCEPTHFRPTLVIGVGGAAGRVLANYRRRLLDRYQQADEIKSWQMLLIDSDARLLRDIVQTGGAGVLRDQDVLATPLRRPEEYRSNSPQLLRWMSRRWLYNIPRSLLTEGIRPLGRLAMVDHFDRIRLRLQDALSTATDPQSLADSERVARRHFFPVTPRVVIVAALSGGTGGGMVFDVAATVRHTLKQMNFPDGEIVGLLLHATERRVGTQGLALANTRAALAELHHYSNAGGYPGDSACKLPPLPAHPGIFDHTYLVHLGDDLNDQEFAQATDQVAEYIYLDSVTPISGFFRRSRAAVEGSENPANGQSRLQLRSFGVRQLGGSNSDVPTALAELLSHHLLQSWRGVSTPVAEAAVVNLSDVGALLNAHGAQETAASAPIEELAAERLEPFRLESLVEQAYGILQREVGGNLESFLAHMMRETQARVAAKHRDTPHLFASRALETFDAILGAQASEEENEVGGAVSLATMLSTRLNEVAQTQGDELQTWSFRHADENPQRIRGAQRFLDGCLDRLRQIEKDSTEIAQQFRAHLTDIRQALCEQERLEAAGASSARGARGRAVGEGVWLDYLRTRVHLVALRCVARQLRVVQGKLTFASDKLRDLWKDLHQLEHAFAAKMNGAMQDDPLADALWRDRDALIADIDCELASTLGPARDRIWNFVVLGQDLKKSLVPHLRAAARRVALRAMKQRNSSAAGRASAEGEEEVFRRELAAAQPRLLNCGGAQRLLIVLPEGSDQEAILDRLAAAAPGQSASILLDTDGDIVVCREAERISLAKAAELIVGGNQQALKAASQLHTRTDVHWLDF